MKRSIQCLQEKENACLCNTFLRGWQLNSTLSGKIMSPHHSGVTAENLNTQHLSSSGKRRLVQKWHLPSFFIYHFSVAQLSRLHSFVFTRLCQVTDLFNGLPFCLCFFLILGGGEIKDHVDKAYLFRFRL